MYKERRDPANTLEVNGVIDHPNVSQKMNYHFDVGRSPMYGKFCGDSWHNPNIHGDAWSANAGFFHLNKRIKRVTKGGLHG